jgi:hypothetical protein
MLEVLFCHLSWVFKELKNKQSIGQHLRDYFIVPSNLIIFRNLNLACIAGLANQVGLKRTQLILIRLIFWSKKTRKMKDCRKS